jgi:hypothetical protein
MFKPADAYRFDWSHEDVKIAGTPMRMKVVHMRLCASRAVSVLAYLLETQEMVFDARARGFAFFGGVPLRGHHDQRKAGAFSTRRFAPARSAQHRDYRRHRDGSDPLATAITTSIRRVGASGCYCNTADLVTRLEEEASIGTAGIIAAQLGGLNLMVLDELGYLPYARSGWQLLCNLISKLDEQILVIIATNPALLASASNWGIAVWHIGKSTHPKSTVSLAAKPQEVGDARDSADDAADPAPPLGQA